MSLPCGTARAAATPGEAGPLDAAGTPGQVRSPGQPGAMDAFGTAALACGAFGGMALATAGWWLPLPPSDPFHGTLALLPALLVGFHLVARWTVARGGRSLSRAGSAGELAALAVAVVFCLARPDFQLPGVNLALAVLFLLVLGHRLGRQLLAARPLLGSALGGRPPLVFFVLPLMAYAAILPWSVAHHQPDGDEPFNLLITHSLAYDGDADLTNNYAAGDWRHFMQVPIAPQPGDPVGPHGELYSRHNLLLPLVLAPAYRLAGLMGALVTMAAMAAALAWMTLRLCRHYAPGLPGEALAAYGLVAFASPLPLYSYQVWVEVPAALLTMVALDRILELDGERRWTWKEWLGIGVPVLLLPLLKFRLMLLAGPLVVLAWWRSGQRRKAILVVGLLLAAVVAGTFVHNMVVYSNPLKAHSWQELDPGSYTPLDYLAGFTGIFFDCAFGLFGCTPLWLLLLPAMLHLLALRHPLPGHLAVLTAPYFFIVSPRGEWYGGWSPPFRYALVILPLLGAALVPLLAQRRRAGARALLAGLGTLTLALLAIWLVMPGWTYSFADGRTHLLDLAAERLGSDIARFFPSSVRPRTATWVWPPLALAAVTWAWWRPRRGSRRPWGATAGVAGLLAGAALLPAAARAVPTHVIELEDAQVWKSGGHLYPDRWVIDRTRYRGGWVLRVGEHLRAPVVAGGRTVRLTLAAEFIRNQPVPFAIDILAGDRLVGTWTPSRERVWESVHFGPLAWPAGAELLLVGRGPYPPGQLNGAILDQVVLDWR